MDSGYQGIAEIHKNSETPKKKPKGGELTKKDKERKQAYFSGTNTNRECQRENQGLQNYGEQVPQPQKTP